MAFPIFAQVVGTKGTYLSHTVDKDTESTVRMDGQIGDTKSPLTFWSAYKLEMDCFVRVLQGEVLCVCLCVWVWGGGCCVCACVLYVCVCV